MFNGEFHILHIFIMCFQSVTNINQLLIQIRPQFFQRITLAFRAHRLRGANTGYHIFALSVHKIFAIVLIFTCCRVTREANTCCRVVTGITEHHGLNITSCTPVTRNIVQLTIGDSTSHIPRTEHGADTEPELFPRVLRHNFAQFFTDFFIFGNQFFQIICCQVGIRFIAFSFLHSFQSAFIFI